MQIREIMTAPVVCATGDTTVYEIAELMRDHDVDSLPVCDGENQLIGFVTDRDIVTRSVASGQNPRETKTEEIMTRSVETVGPLMEVADVSKMMAVKQIRQMPVTENNKVVGMVVLGDMTSIPPYEMEAARALSEITPVGENG